MNIISNDGSNKLNRSRKARVSYKDQRTINASLNAATSTRAVISNPNFVTLFFFSSRRRHTRWPRDWSSDVCSSDLLRFDWKRLGNVLKQLPVEAQAHAAGKCGARSEERRVGKECRYRWTRSQKEKKSNKVKRMIKASIQEATSTRAVCNNYNLVTE